MDRRPWQIWIAYALCLLLTVSGLSWLSGQVIRLDDAEATAREKADIDERVGVALWRMDVALAQLLATEAARPSLAYQPLIPLASLGQQSVGPDARMSPGKVRGAKTPEVNDASAPVETTQDLAGLVCSPLLTPSSDLVLLHFEADRQGNWVSPQCLDGDAISLATTRGVSDDDLRLNRKRLTELESGTQPAELFAKLDDEPISVDLPNVAANYAFNPEQIWVGNTANVSAAPAWQAQQAAIANAPFQGEQVPQTGPSQQVDQQLMAQQQAANPQRNNAPGGRGSKTDNRLEDYNQRFQTLQTAARQAYLNQNLGNGFNNDMLMAAPEPVELTRSQPIWSDGRLLLVRQARSGKRSVLQGCWLDWDAMREQLLAQIEDLLPTAALRPVTNPESAVVSRMLATLPVELVAPEPTAAASWNSPMRIALWVAWVCLVAVALMAAALLNGVLQLSERRASFVSAVTHELRTPLTTFRMYSEMLADGMVAPEKQQGYLDTLRNEADRLSHLVDNVLHYARLERTRQGWELTPVRVADLHQAVIDRLSSRAADCGLQLKVAMSDDVAAMCSNTNVGAVEQVLFNLVDNACKYGLADDARLDIEFAAGARWLEIRVRDYGPGIAADVQRRMFQPFSRKDEVGPAPGVGLGLALCRRLSQQLGGELLFENASPGARFTLRLPLSQAS